MRVFALDVRAIHVWHGNGIEAWMPGTSPGMTLERAENPHVRKQ
ncbi:hypothetical protein ABIB73_003051 [Bradyrhizobium sp. F1.4.3]